jgi:RNA-directed DNA polymerase
VSDRIAQMVVKQLIEPELDQIFLPDSYGYRPRKSALDAVGITRQRCWKYDWVLEFDIKGLFDNLPHDPLQKAIRKHVKCQWAVRPQGGVISPILSNLFLHYAFDLWVKRTYPDLQRWKTPRAYPNVTFDFLGYQFRPRMVENSQDGSLFCSFVPAVSPSASMMLQLLVNKPLGHVV